MSNPLTNENLSRRDFVKQAGAVTAGLASFGIAKGYIERVLKVGLVGCGGRGVGAAVNNLEAQDTTIWSVGDIFPDQAAKAAKRFEIPEERTFSGWDSYIKVLDSGIDVVILQLRRTSARNTLKPPSSGASIASSRNRSPSIPSGSVAC